MVVFANRAGERLAAGTTPLTLSQGRLACRSEQDACVLRRAVEQACRRPRQASAFSLRRSHAQWRDVQVRVVPIEPRQDAWSDQLPTALVFVSDGTATLDVAELKQWCGLTTAEAQLLQLLARGTRLRDCAAGRGVGVATVRTHLSNILAKTGTQSQAQLLAVVLSCRSSTGADNRLVLRELD